MKNENLEDSLKRSQILKKIFPEAIKEQMEVKKYLKKIVQQTIGRLGNNNKKILN